MVGDESGSRPWAHCFRSREGGEPVILLDQLDPTCFALRSSLRYTGPSDVAGPRDVGPDVLPASDLASVPAALQWFVGPYGLHTPAALVHDRLVGDEAPAGYDRVDADTLWLDMLRALGVPPLRRAMMHAAVAAGTQWSLGGRLKLRMLAWGAASLFGMALFVWAVVNTSLPGLVAAIVAPLPFAALWGRQWRAGLVAAVTAIWVLPPTVFGLAGHAVYWCLEWVILRIRGDAEAAERPVSVAEY